MNRFLLLSFLASALGVSASAQVLNAPNNESCTETFDNVYSVKVVPLGVYTGQVLSLYTTAYSAGGSGKGGGYKPGHTTITYSQISSVTVKDSNGNLLATFTDTPTYSNGYQLDNQQGTFTSKTQYVSIEVTGTCEYWYGTTGDTPQLAPGTASFTLTIDGPPLPVRKHPGGDGAQQ